MAVTIESLVWSPNPWLHILIFSASLLSILLLSHVSKKHIALAANSPAAFDRGISSSYLRFQRNFLILYHLVSVVESLGSAFGEFEFDHYGVSKDQMLLSLCVGQAVSLFCAAFFGVFSDIIRGQKKACLFFCFVHVFVGLWKRIVGGPDVLVSAVCSSLSASVFSFGFETWMVIRHDEEGHWQDTVNEVFWLMSFYESVSLIEGQVLSNWLIGDNVGRNISSPSTAAAFLAIIGIVYIAKGWSEVSQKVTPKEYTMSFHRSIFGDKRICLLGLAQACLHFSTIVFWILWTPTTVADGREVNLGLLYACFIGSRMFGAALFPWLSAGILSFRIEEFVMYAFGIMGVVLSITAYDYQEVGVLLTLFCLFNASVGLILPSLAKLRTLYVPNELRGGFISLSQAPAHAAALFFLLQRGYYRNIWNATIWAVAALGVFSAALCIHTLKRLGKQPYRNGPKL